jgi:hypothetical protein
MVGTCGFKLGHGYPARAVAKHADRATGRVGSAAQAPTFAGNAHPKPAKARGMANRVFGIFDFKELRHLRSGRARIRVNQHRRARSLKCLVKAAHNALGPQWLCIVDQKRFGTLPELFAISVQTVNSKGIFRGIGRLWHSRQNLGQGQLGTTCASQNNAHAKDHTRAFGGGQMR